MYLKKTKTSKGRIFLQIVNGYRDQDGKSRQEVIKKVGFLDELIDDYSDPIEHFTQLAKDMTERDLEDRTEIHESNKEFVQDLLPVQGKK